MSPMVIVGLDIKYYPPQERGPISVDTLERVKIVDLYKPDYPTGSILVQRIGMTEKVAATLANPLELASNMIAERDQAIEQASSNRRIIEHIAKAPFWQRLKWVFTGVRP